MDCNPPGSSVHGILQARILEWVAIPFSRGSSPPRDQTPVSHIAGRFLTLSHTGEPWQRSETHLNMKHRWADCLRPASPPLEVSSRPPDLGSQISTPRTTSFLPASSKPSQVSPHPPSQLHLLWLPPYRIPCSKAGISDVPCDLSRYIIMFPPESSSLPSPPISLIFHIKFYFTANHNHHVFPLSAQDIISLHQTTFKTVGVPLLGPLFHLLYAIIIHILNLFSLATIKPYSPSK